MANLSAWWLHDNSFRFASVSGDARYSLPLRKLGPETQYAVSGLFITSRRGARDMIWAILFNAVVGTFIVLAQYYGGQNPLIAALGGVNLGCALMMTIMSFIPE